MRLLENLGKWREVRRQLWDPLPKESRRGSDSVGENRVIDETETEV